MGLLYIMFERKVLKYLLQQEYTCTILHITILSKYEKTNVYIGSACGQVVKDANLAL